ncbi:hypothetical protein [Campylobacter lari]|uniref:hypothetical protein n=1 Tax=Campylobacter lari TaxID=201 RepID=UPI002151FECC|nr:hypothetical protein [Campylobacter lari]MCR6538012.1 hypothetical protein [Campylobacter lari]
MFIGTIGLLASMIACIKPAAAAFVSFLFLGTIYGVIELFALIILSVFLNAKKH